MRGKKREREDERERGRGEGEGGRRNRRVCKRKGKTSPSTFSKLFLSPIFCVSFSLFRLLFISCRFFFFLFFAMQVRLCCCECSERAAFVRARSVRMRERAASSGITGSVAFLMPRDEIRRHASPLVFDSLRAPHAFLFRSLSLSRTVARVPRIPGAERSSERERETARELECAPRFLNRRRLLLPLFFEIDRRRQTTPFDLLLVQNNTHFFPFSSCFSLFLFLCPCPSLLSSPASLPTNNNENNNNNKNTRPPAPPTAAPELLPPRPPARPLPRETPCPAARSTGSSCPSRPSTPTSRGGPSAPRSPARASSARPGRRAPRCCPPSSSTRTAPRSRPPSGARPRRWRRPRSRSGRFTSSPAAASSRPTRRTPTSATTTASTSARGRSSSSPLTRATPRG